jgi:predicted glycoside hydrolase/deacetylase ChbG (UPF0249 family)
LIPAGLIACAIAIWCNSTACDAQTPPARYLIIHGDDAGMSHSANIGTIDAMEKGIVSSASIMVPCPWFVEIAEYAREHPERDFGIHLTLNCEWKRYRWGPVASREKVPSLVDKDGYLWSNVRQVAENAKTEEVEIELRAQIDRARQFAVPITHLDTHMGSIIARPDLVGVYVKLAIEYDVPILFLRTVDENMAKEYPALAEQAQKLLPLFREHKLPLLDQMAQLYGEQPGMTRREAYLETLRKLRPGVSQLIIHCGYDDAELRAITSSAPQRDEDRRVFSDPEVMSLIKELGIQVIGWRQLRAMNMSE